MPATDMDLLYADGPCNIQNFKIFINLFLINIIMLATEKLLKMTNYRNL